MLGTKFKIYVCSFWTYLDLIVLLVAYVDLYLGQLANDFSDTSETRGCKNAFIQSQGKEFISLLRGLRFTRTLRLLRLLVPRLLRRIKRQLNNQVFIGYDMGKGFVETSDAVIKFIPQIAENKKVQQVIRQAMKRERNACVKDLGKKYCSNKTHKFKES